MQRPQIHYYFRPESQRPRGVGNEQFWRTRFPDFSLISPWFPSKMTSYVVKVGRAGGLGWFPSLISRKSALISHDFNLISTDFSTRCTRFLLLPTPRSTIEKGSFIISHHPFKGSQQWLLLQVIPTLLLWLVLKLSKNNKQNDRKNKQTFC